MGSKGDLLVKKPYRKNFRDREPMESMKVVVHNNDVAKALRTLKKKLQNEGVFNELRERVAFQTRGEKKRLARAAGRRRYLKNKEKLKETRGY
jgi:small subunit ribosomal protein S21